MLEKAREKKVKQMEREYSKKNSRKIVFLGGCEEKDLFVKNGIF